MTGYEDGVAGITARAADFLRLRGRLEASPFHFINLGVLAYIGMGQASTFRGKRPPVCVGALLFLANTIYFFSSDTLQHEPHLRALFKHIPIIEEEGLFLLLLLLTLPTCMYSRIVNSTYIPIELTEDPRYYVYTVDIKMCFENHFYSSFT